MMSRHSNDGSARITMTAGAAAVFLLFCLSAAAATSPAAANGHARALAALADVNAAITEIVNAENSTASGPLSYKRAAHRAINALVGESDSLFDRTSGNPGDTDGAIGHLDALLHRSGTPAWQNTIGGADANAHSAVASLRTALKARELSDFQFDVTDALTSLLVARGRPGQSDALGGLEGALATTMLGVPPNAHIVSACDNNTDAPAYATVGGYLIYVAVPAAQGTAQLPEDFGSRDIKVNGDRLIVRTAAAPMAARLCQKQTAAAQSSTPDSAPSPATAMSPKSTPQPAAKHQTQNDAPALYTEAQAQAGKSVYAANCVSCHGTKLQGTAAPAVAGTDFLTTAHKNGWTLQTLQALVTNNMPFNSPGSLSPKQYSEVIAFLLAANCYPAGDKPFPTADDPNLAKIPLAPLAGTDSQLSKPGACMTRVGAGK
jgi:mono/diheme cytochrome c family protein